MTRLRRLLRPVRWTYALGELALIVAGVLIALGANAWWEGREERSRERGLLRQLQADARENERAIQWAISNDSVSAEKTHRVRAALYSAALPAADSVAHWMVDGPGRYSDPRFLLGTLNTVLQTGEIRLIRNDSTRIAVIRYAGEMELHLEELSRYVDRLWEHSAIWWARSERTRFPFPNGPEYFETKPEYWRSHLLALRADLQTRAAFGGMSVANANRLYYLRRMLNDTRTLQKVLAAELAEGMGAAGRPRMVGGRYEILFGVARCLR